MAELMQAYERAREIRGKAAWAEQVIDIADEGRRTSMRAASSTRSTYCGRSCGSSRGNGI
jgi:hypothetical protein